MEIKRCLCGGIAYLCQDTLKKWTELSGLAYQRIEFFVECQSCEAMTENYLNATEAVEEWNKEN